MIFRCFIYFFNVSFSQTDSRNAALNGQATQASTYSLNNIASFSIDGDYTTHSHTLLTEGEVNWLKIDLIHIFQKGEIKIYNSQTNSGRLIGYQLDISSNGVDFKQIAVLTEDLVQTFQCTQTLRFVQIIKIAGYDQFLHVSEVEVWI